MSLFHEFLAMFTRIFGGDHRYPFMLVSLNNVADLFEMNGDYRRSSPLHDECLPKKNRIPGHDSPFFMLITLNCTAVSPFFMGEYDRALPLLEKCLAKRKRTLGDV
jgi:hypothetical protein